MMARDRLRRASTPLELRLDEYKRLRAHIEVKRRARRDRRHARIFKITCALDKTYKFGRYTVHVAVYSHSSIYYRGRNAWSTLIRWLDSEGVVRALLVPHLSGFKTRAKAKRWVLRLLEAVRSPDSEAAARRRLRGMTWSFV